MQLVAVKNKFQIVIPQSVREKIGIHVGDVLEAKIERGKITFTPKSVVDRGIAESLADFEAGRSYGPFGSADDLIASLHKEAAKLSARKKTKRALRK
jgi:AbrB family looped-hinge helix DNA binding protein